MVIKISKEVKIGLIFIFAAAILIWGIMFLKGLELFKHRMTVYAIYDKVNGLVPDNNVAISGMQVGQVKDLYFSSKQRGKIVAVLVITVDYPIPANSIAKINSSSLLGGKYVEIVLGDSPRLIKDQDTLMAVTEATIGESLTQQFMPLKEKAENLISSIDTVASLIQTVLNQQTRNDLIASVSHIRDILNNLSRTTYDLDTLVGEQKSHLARIIENVESISQNLKNNNQNINTILDNFAKVSDSLARARIPATINQISKAVTEIDVAVNRINSGQGTMGLLLNDDKLYKEVEKAARDLNLLLEDIKANPKKYLKVSVL